MHFMLDENVPVSVKDMLETHGHQAEFIRDYVPPGSADPVVATISEELDAIPVSFDGDFEKIAPRIPKGQKRRFRRLSRIWMRCREPMIHQSAVRALSTAIPRPSRWIRLIPGDIAGLRGSGRRRFDAERPAN